MNPYEFQAAGAEHDAVRRKSTAKAAAVYLLVGGGFLSAVLGVAAATMKENGWLLGAAFLALFATVLISAIQYIVSLIPALSLGSWQPPCCGLVAAALVIAMASQFRAPLFLKLVLLPVFFASLVSTLVMRERDWESALAEPTFKPHPVQWILMSLFAVVGCVVSVLTGIGKPILIALGQDVVGVMHSERVEIAVAGGCAGFVGGILLGTIVASMLQSLRLTAN
jgi:hypothetical protein